MVSAKLLILTVFVAAITAAPQFSNENQPPIPYDFAYGVEVPETGDSKEHKQSASPSGRTDGEYRWLQPNGLYTIVRYYVDGDSGFQAEVSEEPGPAVGNYYANSLSQESASGVVSSTNQGFTRSSNVQQPSVGRAVNVISAPRPNQVTFSAPRPNQVSFSAPRPNQVTFSAPRPNQVSFSAPRPDQVTFSAPRPNQVSFSTVTRPNLVSLSSNPRTNQGPFFSAPRPNQASFFSAPQPNPVSFSSSFSSQEQSFGGVVDGGFIDGGFIDGGIIDGGIIDGSVING
ncbi:uncharacterized protein LOC122246997 isoform X1 [Penaeus japonicus]|uniref:uncharacterized protein LOC122246997 isoform X1 n=1 Tax=Penaeus japonicus TaxID=27405 RepID=UPI001C7136FD|nr:uncharacterized protein LOC122246997 isoform X1 [Penaeus japonicus]